MGLPSCWTMGRLLFFFFFQAEDGIRDYKVTGVQTCALPICELLVANLLAPAGVGNLSQNVSQQEYSRLFERSEEHTSELQSPCNLVCRLLLEKKKKIKININDRI